MRQGSGQIFSISLLALLAGMTFILQQAIEQGENNPSGKFRHDPDSTADNFVARRFDEKGELKYRLSGPFMKHFPDDESTEIRTPTLIAYRPKAPEITINAKNARITSRGETVYLWEDVSVTRAATASRPQMVARMPDLTAQPDTGIAFTSSPVEVSYGTSWLTGVGAYIDNSTSTLTLQSQVRAQYIRPTAKP